MDTPLASFIQTMHRVQRKYFCNCIEHCFVHVNIQYFLTLVLFNFFTCILRCPMCIVVSCPVFIVVVVLCVLLSSYVCIAVFTLDAGLLARN